MLDSSGFHPGPPGRNHLRVLARAAGLPAARVDEVLRTGRARVESAGRRVKTYSLGMKQRLNLAAALLGDPQALVLDEPANGLDPQGIRWLRDFLRSMASEGRTVLVSSHVLAEVAQTVDEVVVIHRGRLRAQSTLAELTRRREGAGAVRVRSPDAGRLAELLGAAAASVEAPEPGLLTVQGASAERVGDLAAENRDRPSRAGRRVGGRLARGRVPRADQGRGGDGGRDRPDRRRVPQDANDAHLLVGRPAGDRPRRCCSRSSPSRPARSRPTATPAR